MEMRKIFRDLGIGMGLAAGVAGGAKEANAGEKIVQPAKPLIGMAEKDTSDSGSEHDFGMLRVPEDVPDEVSKPKSECTEGSCNIVVEQKTDRESLYEELSSLIEMMKVSGEMVPDEIESNRDWLKRIVDKSPELFEKDKEMKDKLEEAERMLI